MSAELMRDMYRRRLQSGLNYGLNPRSRGGCGSGGCNLTGSGRSGGARSGGARSGGIFGLPSFGMTGGLKNLAREYEQMRRNRGGAVALLNLTPAQVKKQQRGLAEYRAFVARHPGLSRDELSELWKRYKKQKNGAGLRYI